MLFNLSRIVLLIGVSLLIVFKIRSSKIVRKKGVTFLSVILCLGLIFISGIYPIENLFMHFQSAESVFHYAYFGEIEDVLDGKASCIVIYSDHNQGNGHYIIPKTEEGYEIPNSFTAKKISDKFDRNGSFEVYQVKGTQDYYVVGSVLSNASSFNITDSRGQNVPAIVTEMGDTGTKTVLLYAYVENFTNDYVLYINGIKTTVTG